MKKYTIPLSKPNLTSSDFREIKKCFDSSWISSKSKWVPQFEKSFAKYISHTKYAVAVNSGTSALFLALKSLQVGPGDEVILPSFTMIATINAVVWAGATPILVDSKSKDDWNMDPKMIAKKITSKTKAIIVVHIYGYCCDMDEITKIAKKNNLFLIEDSAEAMGSTYKNKFAGSFGDISCFSLYSNKIITTGNGGMAATNNRKFYSIMQKLRFFDFGTKTHFVHHIVGYNFAFSGLLSALGYSQSKRFSRLIKKRRLIYRWYTKYVKHANIRFIQPLPQTNPDYWFPAIILSSLKNLNKVVRSLEKNKIETRAFFMPIHKQPVFKNTFDNQPFPNAEYFWKHGLLLPSYYDLQEKEVKKIATIIYSCFN